MLTLTENGLEDYKRNLLNQLLRLREENPWCGQKIALQINELSGVQALLQGSVVLRVEHSGFGNN